MSKLTAIHKQIAALQAEAERITKQEMSAAIAKVKGLMSEFGLTIEHLTQSVVGKPAAKKTKAAKATKPATSKPARAAKYADSKTGKTWSGFGRAPAWIAGAKNRDAFLVDKSSIKAAESVVRSPASNKKILSKAVKTAKTAKKATKPAAKSAAPIAKRTSQVGVAPAPAAAKEKPTAKKARAKVAAKKSAPRKSTPTNSGAAVDSGSGS